MARKINSFSLDEWNIVRARIASMPAYLKISIGGLSYGKKDMLEHVDKKDEIGELLVRIQFNYLRSFKKTAEFL